jgi:hypothetical protein
MLKNDCSRREFLKKFAMVSGGALVLSATAMACYGPMPRENALPSVIGMYCLDAQPNKVLLSGNQNVPVHTTFVIDFSTEMNVSVPATVLFVDAADNPVACDKAWNGDLSLNVTPQADLAYNAGYTLTIQDAEDRRGNRLSTDSASTSSFKTVIA